MTEKQLGVAPSGISDTATKAYVDTATPTFDALNTQGNTILTAGFDLTAAGSLEIRATDGLEIPATSTLEIPFWVSALPWQGAAAAFVATQESIASTTYADLATITDSVTVTIGVSGLALVLISANIVSSTSGGAAFMSYAISGASTAAATDAKSIMFSATVTGGQPSGEWGNFGAQFLETGLTAGSTTFKLKYHYNAISGQFFANRRIAVIPL